MNNGNFKLYNASAGSGKTFTLIKEFLLLSLSSDYPNFKNILAVTFTVNPSFLKNIAGERINVPVFPLKTGI